MLVTPKRLVKNLKGKPVIIKTNDLLNRMVVNRALNITDDKKEEVVSILELLNSKDLNKDDVHNIRCYIMGVIHAKRKLKK